MNKRGLLILADDLTGALDTGVQFAKKGIETCVYPFLPAVQEPLDQNVVCVINTNSRHVPPEEASAIVEAAVSTFKTYSFFYKKTDSCLRGNIGSELEALLHATGNKQLPFVPAYPALKRTTKDGSQYLDGKPIHKSDMAHDPFNPITESFIPAIIEKQSAIPVRLIPVNDKILVIQNNPEILVFDAETPEHLFNIAHELCKTDMLAVSAGCAGFAEALMEVLPLEKHEIHNKDESLRHITEKLPILIISGSLHPVSVNQIRAALKKNIPGFSISGEIMVSPGWAESAEAETLTASCVQALEEQGICVFGTDAAFGAANAERADVTPKAKTGNEAADTALMSDNIANALGKTALKIINKIGPLHLVVFGGDSLLGIIKSLNYNCIRPQREILPGIVVSYPPGQTCGSLLVTKAGAFGDTDVIRKIAEYIGGIN